MYTNVVSRSPAIVNGKFKDIRGVIRSRSSIKRHTVQCPREKDNNDDDGRQNTTQIIKN